MKLFYLFLILFTACKSKPSSWYLISNEDQVSKFSPFGYTSGYINEKGDTVIALNQYARCFTDTFIHYAIVYDTSFGLIGIDKSHKHLFNAVWNGEGGAIQENEGFILIKDNSFYGYANHLGKIVIKPIYSCAHSFKMGKAKVSLDSHCTQKGSNNSSNPTWFYIDKKGRRIKE